MYARTVAAGGARRHVAAHLDDDLDRTRELGLDLGRLKVLVLADVRLGEAREREREGGREQACASAGAGEASGWAVPGTPRPRSPAPRVPHRTERQVSFQARRGTRERDGRSGTESGTGEWDGDREGERKRGAGRRAETQSGKESGNAEWRACALREPGIVEIRAGCARGAGVRGVRRTIDGPARRATRGCRRCRGRPSRPASRGRGCPSPPPLLRA